MLTCTSTTTTAPGGPTATSLVEAALAGRHPELVEPVAPPDDAMFVVKARHSIFFQTPLEYLLAQEGVDRVVLTGQVTEQCILYSALDAYIRHLDVVGAARRRRPHPRRTWPTPRSS